MQSQSPRLALLLFSYPATLYRLGCQYPPEDDTTSQGDVEAVAPALEPMGLRLFNPASDATDPSKENARGGYREQGLTF